jgi:hypothetical protein
MARTQARPDERPTGAPPERVFYLSWVDKRTDPWPNWEKCQPGAAPLLEGQAVQFLPETHSLWPGMPFVPDARPLIVADGRMGRYSFPGLPLPDGTGRLYVGPTLSALFHPRTPRPLGCVERAFLLFQPDSPGSPHEVLQRTLLAIAKARGITDARQRVQFTPIPGIADPTDYDGIYKAIRRWLDGDPFGFGGRRANRTPTPTRIVVNLSPGTAAMAADWLILRWSGALGRSQATIEFVQGDGGLDASDTPENPTFSPLRIVPVDVLSLVKPQEAAPTRAAEARPGSAGVVPVVPGEAALNVEGMKGSPYDRLRREIEQAACLGLPILLEGERGTGKTSLAEYYHQRRQFYRAAVRAPVELPAAGKTKGKLRVRFPEIDVGGQFVKITLSEFADLDTLRDTLFGWSKGSWTGADDAYDGLLGEAHLGTLFMDEIHHLDRKLQPLLLGPLNIDSLGSRRYKPKMATYDVISDFDLVVATNDPAWRDKMIPDLLERLERIVVQVPSFRSFQRDGVLTIWQFWEFTLKKRCERCGLEYTQEGDWSDCSVRLLELFTTHPLPGNWRDLQRLADNTLLCQTDARDGRPTALTWSSGLLEDAIRRTFERPGTR